MLGADDHGSGKKEELPRSPAQEGKALEEGQIKSAQARFVKVGIKKPNFPVHSASKRAGGRQGAVRICARGPRVNQ